MRVGPHVAALRREGAFEIAKRKLASWCKFSHPAWEAPLKSPHQSQAIRAGSPHLRSALLAGELTLSTHKHIFMSLDSACARWPNVRVEVPRRALCVGAKRESGAGAASAEAGAAPATVSGELRSMTCHWRPGFMPWRREGRTEATTREPGDLPRHITSSGGVSGQVAGPARPLPSFRKGCRVPARAWSPRQNQHRRGPCPSPLHRSAFPVSARAAS